MENDHLPRQARDKHEEMSKSTGFAGGEGGGFTILVNYASFLCAPAGRSKWPSGMPGGYKNCRPPPASGPLPNGTACTGVSGVIVLDSCVLDSNGTMSRFKSHAQLELQFGSW